jgi:hypothetical protein
MYVFNLLETYVAGLSLLSTVFFEAIAVSWLYGRYGCRDIQLYDILQNNTQPNTFELC